MISKEEAQKQVQAVCDEMLAYAAEHGMSQLPDYFCDMVSGSADVNDDEVLTYPQEALMAAFARVYTGDMAPVITLVKDGFGWDITTPGWFDVTDPKPTQQRLNAQTGVHIEEVSEMFDNISSDNRHLNDKMLLANTLLKEIGEEFKSGRANLVITNVAKFHDSLDDQRVTVQGTGKLSLMNCAEVTARVDWSNHTKFINGEAIYKEGGKVAKGPYWEEAKPVDIVIPE